MNDALRQELAAATRHFSASTTAEVRRALISARQLDRNGEAERRLRLIEAGCLARDHDKSGCERALMAMGRLTSDDWAYLDRLLATAPERIHPGFERYRSALRRIVEIANGSSSEVAQPPAHAIDRSTATPEQPMPLIEVRSPQPSDPMTLAALILGISAVLLGVLGLVLIWLGVIALLPGCVGASLTALAPSRSRVWLTSLILCVVGTTVSFIWLTILILAIIYGRP
jgi:hypothetical protein